VPQAEGLASLAVAARVTTAIRLGVGVIPLDSRPPDAIARRIDELGVPVERLVLGVGSGSSAGPLARVRAGVPELAERISAPVIVGALGPKMSALAGEVSDGVLFNWLTPEQAATDGRAVVAAAASVGRSSPALMAYVRCALLPRAEARLREEIERYAGIESYRRHMARMGAQPTDTCVRGTDAAALRNGIERFEAVLDETVVRAITPDDSLDELAALARACAPA
jgi:alkanesulfonate monooxygenase SsuD/methylene tetrahydromethanopterin reductase-like flavin-dependent oxidoreductase (luciferase family)